MLITYLMSSKHLINNYSQLNKAGNSNDNNIL